jgi:hypothetical protein
MKHIKLYEEQEPDKSGKMLGVIVHVFGYGRDVHMDDYYACVAPTFWDIATAILEDYMDPDDVEEKVSGMTSLYDISETIHDFVEDADELDVTIWTGLIPRSQTENYDAFGGSINPYDIVESIDKSFTNAKSVMQGNKGGASNNDLIKLIGDSIANDPSKFALYADDPDLDKIIKSIGWPDDRVKSLLRYSNIRNQI